MLLNYFVKRNMTVTLYTTQKQANTSLVQTECFFISAANLTIKCFMNCVPCHVQIITLFTINKDIP